MQASIRGQFGHMAVCVTQQTRDICLAGYQQRGFVVVLVFSELVTSCTLQDRLRRKRYR